MAIPRTPSTQPSRRSNPIEAWPCERMIRIIRCLKTLYPLHGGIVGIEGQQFDPTNIVTAATPAFD
jgi:hypothetical protein